MATTYKILGQAVATAGAAALVPTSTNASRVVSSVVVANVTATATTLNLNACINSTASAAASSNALVWGATVLPNSTVSFTLGITLAAADTLNVSAGLANYLVATAFGSEIV